MVAVAPFPPSSALAGFVTGFLSARRPHLAVQSDVGRCEGRCNDHEAALAVQSDFDWPCQRPRQAAAAGSRIPAVLRAPHPTPGGVSS